MRSIKKLFFSSTLLIAMGGSVSAADCKLSTEHWRSMHHASIALVKDSGEQSRLRVRVADEPGERSAGFQHICPEIIELSSILFVYERPNDGGFHMSNVHAELDIGFFDSEGQLFQVTRMKPQTDESSGSNLYSADMDFLYALETRAGYFSENGLEAGTAKIKF